MALRSSEQSTNPNRSRVFAQGISGATLVALALTACGEREAGAQPGNRPTSSVSTDTEPGTQSPMPESPSPTDLPTTSPTTSPTQSPEASPTSSPEVTIDMNEMSAEKFSKFPVDVRTDYALSNYYTLSEDGSLFDFVDQQLTNGNKLYDYNPYQTPLDVDAEGDKILLAHLYAEQVSRAWKHDITVAGGGEIDNETASKMIAGVAYDPESKVYASHLDSIKNSNKVGRLKDEDINGSLVIDTSSVREAKQTDGSIRPERTLTVVSGGKTYKETFVFVDKGEILGEGNGLWLLSKRESVKQ